MIRSFFSVGVWTLVSRVTGFARDILLAGFLGAGMMMDAFTVAFRLPNHFRSIFAEGAFSTAFIPAFTRIRIVAGEKAADRFQGQILSMVVLSQLVLLALVLAFTPGFVRLLAPGFIDRPDALALATELTRITFPYLALITLVVLWTGVLNAEKQFIEGAAAPVLLNLAMISTLLAGAMFSSMAHAAAWGILIAGFLEAGLLCWGAARAGLLARPRMPSLDPEVRRFFKAFGPAVIGSAGVQLAMFADTIIVTFLPQGGASSLYYADRLYQLPIGVIGIAASTVLLPEMSRLLSIGQEKAAHEQQNRALILSWLLTMPFFVAFLSIPETIVGAMFERGAFNSAATANTAKVLAAYAIGLPAIVAIRSIVSSFHARGDTSTPLYASLTAIAINLVLKLIFWKSMGAAGLAAATAIGAIANFVILYAIAWRQKKTSPDSALGLRLAMILVATICLAGTLTITDSVYRDFTAIVRLTIDGLVGGTLYASLIYLGFRSFNLPLTLR